MLSHARKYKNVPNIQEDNVIPSVSEIPSLLTTLRHPRRSRSISIGPQSAADAYETLAFREKHRRESGSSLAEKNAFLRDSSQSHHPESYFGISTSNNAKTIPITSCMLPTPAASELDLYQHVPVLDPAMYTPPAPDAVLGISRTPNRRLSEDRRQYEKEDRDMFSKLEKPRVRYDVEVITKLIVYCGMLNSRFNFYSGHVANCMRRYRLDRCRRKSNSF